MSAYEFTVSLRVRHPAVDPAEISRQLALEPEHAWQAGEPRDEGAEASSGNYRESYWIARITEHPQLASDTASVEQALAQALSHLRRSQGFLEMLKAQGGQAECLISIYGRETFALEFSSETFAMFGRVGCGMVLDIHPHARHGSSE